MNRAFRHHLAACRRDCRAAIAVEFALLAPVLVVALLGLADYAVGFSALIKLRNAVEAGASYCLIHGASSCTSGTVASTVAASTGLPITTGNVTVDLQYGCATASGVTLQGTSTANCAGSVAPGRYATVTATYDYVTTLGRVTIPLSATTVLRIQ